MRSEEVSESKGGALAGHKIPRRVVESIGKPTDSRAATNNVNLRVVGLSEMTSRQG